MKTNGVDAELDKIDELEKSNSALKKKVLNLERQKRDLGRRVMELESRLNRHCSAENSVVAYLRGFVSGGSARLTNYAKHIRKQLLGGGMRGKREFFKWFCQALKRKNSPDPAFNPFWNVYDMARRTFAELNDAEVNEHPVSYMKFDVLFFPVIEYEFRYQRPQQIADYYARRGHRVFYFRPTFDIGDGPVVRQIRENVFEVVLCFKSLRNVYSNVFDDVEDDLHRQLDALLRRFSILDAISICEYPNWINAIRFLKRGYLMTDVLDYLDDWDGFENTATPELTRNTHAILGISSCVVATSAYLAEKARKYARNVAVVRNGTEFSHFNRAYSTPPAKRRGRKVGYYGAIAHWFDVGKIRSLAKALPDVEIELIGAVSTDVSSVRAFSNVKFLGEKPYAELPDLIKDWDVCLIPFDTSTDLIKATNPVKFYEYLSAGKKIVATEIPELAEFGGRLAILANDDAAFVSAVESCLNGTDGLASPEERIGFARGNSWDSRLSAINGMVLSTIPKFSIVVLTYNQLDYTRLCLGSLLKWTAYPNYELIVVDNASSDGSREYLKSIEAKYPQMRLMLNDDNLGFAAGNNIGLKSAKGDYLLLLNNDTIVPRGWLSRFLAHFRNHPECGAAGPVSNSIGNEAKVQVGYESIRGFVEEAAARAFDMAFEHFYEPCPAMFCYAFPRAVMDRVGLLSKEYGLGMFEDEDYCAAIHMAGFATHGLEDVLVHHFLSVSFDDMPNDEMLALHRKNREIFERKWNTTWTMHKFRGGVDWPTNDSTAKAFSVILKQGRSMLNSSASSLSPFKDDDFRLDDFIEKRRLMGDYAGVYVLPSIPWDYPIFQRPQQMALAFAKKNYLVIYVECEYGKYRAGHVRNVSQNIVVLTAVDSWKAIKDISGCIVSIYSTSTALYGFEDMMRGFLDRNTVYYEYIDHFDEKITGATERLLAFYGKATSIRSRIRFIASARNLQRELTHDSGRNVLYVPNAVDAEHFSGEYVISRALQVSIPDCLASVRPKVGYFGAMAPWLDYSMLNKVMESNPHWDFVFIGMDYNNSLRKLRQDLPNCHWLGPVAYKDLPVYAARFDVAILPFESGRLAKSTSPVKLFEYFALGKPVVVTPDMEECRAFAEVLVGDGAQGFSSAIGTALEKSRDPQFVDALHRLANNNSWTARVQTIIHDIENRV